MKKVFLSLAVIAALTVVSCKQKEAEAAPAADTTAVAPEAAPVVADTAKVEAPAAEAPAAETPAAPAKK